MFKTTLIATSLMTVFISMLLTSAANAESISRLQLLADVCAVCHGTDGRGANKVPKLNEGELKVDDFTSTMHGFVSGEERATVMDRIAKGLKEDDFKLLADYFATLKP
jgi:cytochrome subunit of sulfide dehydrogenase